MCAPVYIWNLKHIFTLHLKSGLNATLFIKGGRSKNALVKVALKIL